MHRGVGSLEDDVMPGSHTEGVPDEERGRKEEAPLKLESEPSPPSRPQTAHFSATPPSASLPIPRIDWQKELQRVKDYLGELPDGWWDNKPAPTRKIANTSNNRDYNPVGPGGPRVWYRVIDIDLQ